MNALNHALTINALNFSNVNITGVNQRLIPLMLLNIQRKVKEIPKMFIFSKIGQVINFVKTIMSIYPELMELIKAVETPGNGAAKLEIVLGLVVPIFEALPDNIKEMLGGANLKQLLTGAINAIVAFFNLTGIFKKDPVVV
jgi:hypothetical protein